MNEEAYSLEPCEGLRNELYRLDSGLRRQDYRLHTGYRVNLIGLVRAFGIGPVGLTGLQNCYITIQKHLDIGLVTAFDRRMIQWDVLLTTLVPAKI